ncbi:NUDIX hydrolase [Myceligenerans halotolerans]
MPGGTMEPGESVRHAAVRETKEETRCVGVTGLVGVYTDPRHVIAYSDGVCSQFSIGVTATVTRGEIRASSESSEVVWQPVGRLGELAAHPTNRFRIDHVLDAGRTERWHS